MLSGITLAADTCQPSSPVHESKGNIPSFLMSREAVAVDHETLKAREKLISSYVYNFAAKLVQPPVRKNGWSSLKQGAGTSPSLLSSVLVLMMGAPGSLGSLLVQHLAELSEVSTVVA